ncbi:MAG TPA: DegT/DnrJ/EryC1/StrS family aminotransferase [Nanoarchaeota archaeon]|nr:DegT/DnrJ/EryC1/StrS family aminotransferase [Nanoarchaeota archaeon]
MNIQLVDLKRRYLSLKTEIDSGIKRIIDNTSFIKGEDVALFENEFAAYCGKKYGIGCANGTVALHLALLALGIGKGDEVITVPNTFIATSESVSYVGGKVKFVDIDEKAMLMDLDKLEKAITPRTKAVIPVHLYGQMVDMKHLMEIAEKHNLKIIEDCAQCHGAEQNGRKAPYHDIGTFSMFPAKIMGAFGDAGVIVADTKGYAEKMKMLTDHGRLDKYNSAFEGYNYRLDTLQAAILRPQLKKLDEWVARRRHLAKLYNGLLNGIVETPFELSGNKHAYYMYVIKTKKRDELMKKLKEFGISTGVHYPIPLHLQPAYAYLKLKEGSFPVAEKCAKEIVSLPLFPEMSEEEVKYVAECVRNSL